MIALPIEKAYGEADMDAPVELSVILPVFNEQECIEATLRELDGALARLGRSYEIIAVNDGSTDRTPELIRNLARTMPALRLLSVVPNSGQSAAMGAGFKAARGAVAITMDADGQNDPADIPRLIEGLREADVCCGYRVNRRDTIGKRWGSRLANAIRRVLLHDGIIDTGCTLKAFKSVFVRDLPMQFRGMHRFLPVLTQMQGALVVQIPVNHRPRAAGVSKYTNLGRLRQTIGDLRAVRWMQTRHRRFTVNNA